MFDSARIYATVIVVIFSRTTTTSIWPCKGSALVVVFVCGRIMMAFSPL